MTTYTAVSDAVLAQDKPFTQSIARALRDNPLAIGEASLGAPRSVPASLNFPYFLATRSTNQTGLGNGVTTKIQAGTEVFDPDSLYDNVTNYRFTPTKAGLYRVSVYVEGTTSGTASTQIAANVGKNGSVVATMSSMPTASSSKATALCETIAQLNGSTDYVEAFVSFPTDALGTCVLNSARFFSHAICEI